MARATFGGGAADWVMSTGPAGQMYVRPATLTFWDAQTGGTQYTDLLVGAVPTSTISVPRDGQVPVFSGPDNIGSMWADAGSGDRVRLVSDKSSEALQSDTFIAEQVANPASETATALSATIEADTAPRINPTRHAPALGLFFPEAEGAVGDGTTDDTASLQAAWTAALAEGGVLHLAPTTYRTTAPLVATNPTAGFIGGPRVQGAGKWLSMIKADFDGGAVFDIAGCQTTAPGSSLAFMRGGGFRDFGIEQAVGRTGVVGIKAIGWWYASINQLSITSLSSHGIHVPLRTDINVNPDYYASAAWDIQHCDISLNAGKGIYGEGGLAFSLANISHNRITNNLSDGIWIAGHSNRVIGNALAANGMYDGATTGPASGLVNSTVTGQAIPNELVVENNEFQGNVTANVRLVAAVGYRLAYNRMLSDVTTVSAVTALYPPVHVQLGDAGNVQPVGKGEIARNYHRSTTTGSHPLSLYKVAHTSAANTQITEPQCATGDNTSAMVKYDGFNVNHRTEIIEDGAVVAAGPTGRYYLGRLRTATNVTGTLATIAFDNEWQDPKNDNDPALGYLTKYLGAHRVSGYFTISGLASGNTVTIRVMLAGSLVKEIVRTAGGVTDETFDFDSTIYASAGSRITIQASQNSGADKAIKVGDNFNELSIVALR